MLALGTASVAMDAGWWIPDPQWFVRASISYAWIAAALPVVMLEWFQPSEDARVEAVEV